MYSFCAPDDGRRNRLKTCRASVEINKARNVAFFWAVIWNYVTMHGHMNTKFEIKILYTMSFWLEYVYRSL